MKKYVTSSLAFIVTATSTENRTRIRIVITYSLVLTSYLVLIFSFFT